jgi:2-desacetyl-2-hydroxyethyl bacteriochlorophyllide A dehydrogenase
MISRVIRFTGERQLSVVDEAVATPGPGEILVRTRCSLISTGTETTVFARRFAPGTHWDKWVTYPFFPGYLNAGVIEAVGAGVTQFKPGQRIASRMSHRSVGLLEVGRGGTDASAGECTPSSLPTLIPEGVSDEQACWMGLGKITQVGVRAAEHRLGDDVVVIGLGLLGQLLVQWARLAGARSVIAIDPAGARHAYARSASHRLADRAEHAVERVREVTAGRLADVVYDASGHPAVFGPALAMCRRHGRVVLIGDAGAPAEQRLTPDLITRGITVVGAHDAHAPLASDSPAVWTAQRMADFFIHLISTRQIDTASLISHRFQPDDAASAYDLLETRRDSAMGVLFDWSGTT